MGYERKSLQILGGGWNPLPSVDKVPDTDYLLAQNWRVDRVGKLVSRYGYPQKFSIAGAGVAHSAGQHGGVEGDYYVACNKSGGANGVYYNFGTSAIATGFDGGRVGFAAMNRYEYIMNRGNQGRHSSTGWEQWGITPPSASPTASTAATPSASSSVTFTYTPQAMGYLHYLTVNGTTYSFPEIGYGTDQVALVVSILAQSDPNVTVTYPGTGQDVTITPIPQNTLIVVSGSDGNTTTDIGSGTINQLPNGIYKFYYTYADQDSSLESNPSPVGPDAGITLSNQGVSLVLAKSSDSRVKIINVYATGGNLGQAYLIGSVANPTGSTVTQTFVWSDLDVTSKGVVMPIDNDLPPAAAGLLGPYYSRLYAWSSAANPNRVWYTRPNLPQYWNVDPDAGDWFDVGAEGEAVLWATQHTNVMVFYKERSTWVLIGDPESDSSVLEQVHDSIGIAGAFGVVNAGQYDYLVSSQGLHKFNLSSFEDAAGVIRPLLNASNVNTGTLTPPGAIAPGANYLTDSLFAYALSLGYAMGKLYIGFTETSTPTSYCLAVYDEPTGRWFYHKNAIPGVTQFQGFFFDGVVMAGLTGSPTGAAFGFNVDDFRTLASADPGGVPIECVYQAHYEDCGLPDNDKTWLEVVIDYELAGDTANVLVGYNSSATLSFLGTISGSGRRSQGFSLDPNDDGVNAKNISVAIQCFGSAGRVILHNVHVYFYPEARLAQSASSIPTDLGSAKVKQVKELELDVNASGGNVLAKIYSDLPGNALALRQSRTVAGSSGRAIIKYPISVTEGYLWRLALQAADGPFRLYSARLLTRAIGTYVEAYEAASGFVWDSGEQTFDSGITHIPRGYAIALAALPIKRARQIRLEIDAAGPVTVSLLTDLPGDVQAVRFSGSVAATVGRRFVSLPLPSGFSAPIEGRMFRLQLSGASKFLVYSAAIEVLPVGVYVEAYEAAGGAIYDSREVDFGTPAIKEARDLEIDLETDSVASPINVQLWSDVSNTAPFTTTAVTRGRGKVLIPLTLNAPGESFVEGRLFRLLLGGTNGFRLYGARIRTRPFGTYMLANEGLAGALWDSTDIDFGTQSVKQFREIELDIAAADGFDVTIYTDLPGNQMFARTSFALSGTTGRTKVQIPLSQGGVPDNYYFGRLVRVTVTSADNLKLFGARIHWRPIGVYVESAEASEGAVWDSSPFDCGNPNTKTFDELRIEMDSDDHTQVAVYTDLPGESYTLRKTYNLTTGPTSRHWATVPLVVAQLGDVFGRAIRMLVSSPAGPNVAGFRLYRAQVRSSRIGRYLAASSPAGNDAFSVLEFDFESERVKQFKKIEIDLDAPAIALLVSTDQSGTLAVVDTVPLSTSGRHAISFNLPNGTRGRLLRLTLTGTSPARIYRLRVWARPLNEPGAKWAWENYPLEASDQLPAWVDVPMPETPAQFSWGDLPVAPTPVEWAWAPLPVAPTEPQWFWAQVLSVEETPDVWEWVNVDISVQ